MFTPRPCILEYLHTKKKLCFYRKSKNGDFSTDILHKIAVIPKTTGEGVIGLLVNPGQMGVYCRLAWYTYLLYAVLEGKKSCLFYVFICFYAVF